MNGLLNKLSNKNNKFINLSTDMENSLLFSDIYSVHFLFTLDALGENVQVVSKVAKEAFKDDKGDVCVLYENKRHTVTNISDMESTIKRNICDHEGVIENAGTSECNIQNSYLTLVQRFIGLLYITIKLYTTDTMMSMSASFQNLNSIKTQLARPASHIAVMAIVHLLPFIIEVILNECIPSTQRRWDNTKICADIATDIWCVLASNIKYMAVRAKL